MAYSYVRYTGNGSTTNYVFPFPYINSSHVKVRLNGVLNTNFSFLNASTIQLTTAPASGVVIEIRRETPKDSPIVNFTDGSILLERDLDLLATFDTYVAQETEDSLDESIRKNSVGVWDADSSRIGSVADPVNTQDAATKNYVDVGVIATMTPYVSSASASASAAAASAASASASQSSATASASSASTSASTATTQASNASTSATAAASSASAAAASAASGMYSAVQDKNANYTIVSGDNGYLLRIDTSGGARTITLPAISTLSDGFKVAIVKWTGDTNAVTVQRSGSDTINGATTALISSQYTQITFVADFETSQWFAVTSGLGSTNVLVDVFNGNNSTVAFTLSGSPGTKNNTYVYVGGVYQQKSTYSLSGTTLTFTQAPPSGTGNIEVVWTQPLAVGVPSDGTVTTAKLVDGAATGAKLGSDVVVTSGNQTVAGNKTFTGSVAFGNGGGGNNLGALVSRGGTTNFYEAYDGTKSFIAGTDASNAYVKVGSLSSHPVAIVQGNTNAIYIDTSGRVTLPSQPAFKAAFSTAADTTFSNNSKLPFNALGFDRGSNYSTANSRFTAPVAGTYYFYCSVYGTSSGGNSTMALRLYKNGVDSGYNAADVYIGNASGQVAISQIQFTGVLQLAANDYVEMYGTGYNASALFRVYTGQSVFTGFLLG